ncbi:uncharacterized protein LOC141704141 [Apium graveolens]|uniref:uncharacterized protein LOC141704141 n=1 Tax=Apium graveolens TaxID=4045 RepID=UPI003D7A5AA5
MSDLRYSQSGRVAQVRPALQPNWACCAGSACVTAITRHVAQVRPALPPVSAEFPRASRQYLCFFVLISGVISFMATSSSGTLTGKFLELVDGLKKRHDAICEQENKWKGAKTKEANGFKLWYSGVVTNMNGVGIILRTQLRNNVEVIRFNDRVMMIKLVVDVVVVNIVSAYAPHAGLGDEEEKLFWDCLDDLVYKRLAKRAVVEAKDKVYEEMYTCLSKNEGANGIYKLAKAREKRQRDLGFARFIKDENARVLVKDDDIKCRWYHYFRQLFNESRISGEEIEWETVHQSYYDSNIQPINGEEIELALRKMGKSKATGPVKYL